MGILQPGWSQFAHSSSLAFRTACNEGAPSPFRPVRSSVLEAIADSREARRIFEDVVSTAKAVDESAIIAALVGDARWRTLMVEIVDDVNRRGDQYKSVTDFCVRAWQWFRKKPSDGSPSPAERVVTAAVTVTTAIGGGATGIAIIKFMNPEALAVPVSVLPGNGSSIRVNLNTEGPQGPLPIRFALETTGATSIPIELIAKPQAVSIGLSVADIRTFENIQKSIASIVTSIESTNINTAGALSKDISDQLAALRQSIASIHAPPAPDIKPAVDALTQIANALDRGTQAEGLQRLTEQMVQTGFAINRLRGLAAVGRTLTTVAAPQNTATTVRVDWPNAVGAVDVCDLTISLGDIGRTVDVAGVSVKCGGTSQTVALGDGVRHLRKGDVLRLGAQGLAISVDSIDRPLFGANSTLLRVISGATTEEANPANMRRTATSDRQ